MDNFDQIKSVIDTGLESVKGKLDEKLEALTKSLDDAKKDKASREEMLVLQKSVKEVNDLATRQSEIIEEIQAWKAKGATEVKETSKGFQDAVLETLEGINKTYGSIGKELGRRPQGMVRLKAPADMTTAANVGAGVILPEQRAGIVGPLVPSVRIANLFAQTTTGQTNSYSFVQETTPEGGFANQVEGAAKSQFDFNLAAVNAPIQTIPGFLRITRQMLDDVRDLSAYINMRLPQKFFDQLATQLVSGDGIGENLLGLSTGDTPFAYTGAQDLTAQAIDVLNVAYANLVALNHDVNGIAINKATYIQMLRLKATDGQYLDTLNMVNNQLYAWGIPVFGTNDVAAGTYIIGDWSQAFIAMREGFNIRFSEEDGSNFTTNKVTIRGEARLAFPKLRPTAFTVGNFAADIAVMKAP